MTETQDLIVNRIKSIRKSKRRSIHDCARILGISKETYHSMEKGTTPISLPELELLAIFLSEDLSEILSSKQRPPSKDIFLNDDIRLQFIKVRGKMLRALIALTREERAVSLTDIQQATHIPLETLEAFDQGASPLPIEDLVKICAYLEIPIDTLLELDWPGEIKAQEDHPKVTWAPDFTTKPSLNDPDLEEPDLKDPDFADPYAEILKALQKVPKQDQAYIAKYLLERLRSM